MRWIESSPSPSPSFPDLPVLVSQTLARAGITTPEATRAFLDPEFYQPAVPTSLPGMDLAVDRLLAAIRKQERVCVWGDFDVDGQTSTAVLAIALRSLGGEPSYYLPVRATEGHGISTPGLKRLIDSGVKLLVTCDTGTSATEAIAYAKSRRVEVIVTDHHEMPEELPPALCIINPHTLPADHPLASLAGVGVAYQLAQALFEKQAPPEPAPLLDLVALGLVADLAALTGDCRYLVQKGLIELRQASRPGLQAILSLADLDPAYLTEEHIGFVLAPRLNALGRLGDANPAVELLTTRDPGRARVLAALLESYNAQRRVLTSQVVQAAEAQLEAEPDLREAPVLLLISPRWPGGVLGLAASHLAGRYGKPAIVVANPPGEVAHASARSVEGVDITQAIARQKDLLIGFGGHPMAAGFSIEPENLAAFRRRLQQTVGELQQSGVPMEHSIQVDAWLSLPEITLELAESLAPLAPFGPGNPRLNFASRGLRVQRADRIGKEKEHARWTMIDGAGQTAAFLWWNGGDEPVPEARLDLAYSIRASSYRGERQVTAELIDYRILEEEPVEVTASRIELVDYRGEKNKAARLADLPEGTLVWAEAEDKERAHGVDRFSLRPAPALAIWTIPPSVEELRQALETVQPGTIYLFAAHPPLEITENFLARLTGLIKFAINHREGKVSLPELANATAQREVTLERGIHWLVSHGDIILKHREADTLWLAPGSKMNDPAGAAQLFAEVQSLLAETAAYRAHFARADQESILPDKPASRSGTKVS